MVSFPEKSIPFNFYGIGNVFINALYHLLETFSIPFVNFVLNIQFVTPIFVHYSQRLWSGFLLFTASERFSA